MISIALDMMGGDYAPEKAIEGVALFLQQYANPDIHLVLIGDEPAIQSLLAQHNITDNRIHTYHTTQVIDMHEHPTKALKEKKDSSIAVGFGLLAAKKAHAFISAGNTGAMMVGALFSIKTIAGVLRPTIGAYIPREDGSLGLLLDVGLNADCKPENLNQFAVMGSLFAQHVLGIAHPKTGLINLGEEEGKGNLLAQAAYPLLKNNAAISFIGNVEGRDILLQKADVMVCEGFTGNVMLKFAESIYDVVQRRHIQDEYFERFNFEIYGGVPVLGVSMPVIIGHGISGAHAFKNMIETAVRMLQSNLSEKIATAFAQEANQE